MQKAREASLLQLCEGIGLTSENLANLQVYGMFVNKVSREPDGTIKVTARYEDE